MNDRFLRACRSLPVDRPPVWMMRQAGRYLPEYRKVRQQVSFLELCKDPRLLCEVTLQPIDRYGMDAAILFSDIMVPLEAMGVSIDFAPGPVIADPIRTRAQVSALAVPDPADSVPYVLDGIRAIRKSLGDRAALIGFAGAPYTLATYLVEGEGRKQFTWLGRLLLNDEPAGMRLLEKLSRTVSLYLNAQIEAGAQALQIFDTWAGNLSVDGFRRYCLPFVQQILEELSGKVPVIYFAKGCSAFLEVVAETGADVIGLDWQLPIEVSRRILGKRAVQGNLEPVVLFGPEELVRRSTRDVLRGGGGVGHIFNLGHGVHKDTPPEAVGWMVDEVKRWSEKVGAND